jgi:hypothetical protein
MPGDPIAIIGTSIEQTDDVHSTDLFDDVDGLLPLVGATDHDDPSGHDCSVPRNGSIVATPGWEIPSPFTTLPIVFSRICRSSRIER